MIEQPLPPDGDASIAFAEYFMPRNAFEKGVISCGEMCIHVKFHIRPLRLTAITLS
jgi:hypothetical protein